MKTHRMQKVTDIFNKKKPTFSFEFFPPKTEEGIVHLQQTARVLADEGADWFSVTYGAGGSTKELTLNLVSNLQNQLQIPVLHHLTCVGYTAETLRTMIGEMKKRGVHNIVALRGDPPKGQNEWQAQPGGFQYCYQLIDLIKEFDEHFSIGVAGFPEGHINCPSLELDTKYLQMKLNHGGQYVITQFFFDNQQYFDYVSRVRKAGIKTQIIPGILPIVNYERALNMAYTNGTSIPPVVHKLFAPIADDKEATVQAGYEYALTQCRELLDGGAPGIHLFALNRLNPALELFQALKQYLKQ